MKLEQARARGLLFRWRKGGRYSEKLFTLTIPHHERDTVRGRIESVLSAWKYFLKSFNAWARSKKFELEWVRVLEWTQGSDNLGHPHLHVWIFSPYLPQDFLSAWWREALERAGLLLGDQEELLDVDIRAAGDDVADELIKYLCKDIGAGGEYVAPATFAEVYAALDGRRAMQGSSGFLALGDAPSRCRYCGASGSLRVRARQMPLSPEQVKKDLARLARSQGPPSSWDTELEASFATRLADAESSSDGLGRARECAVCAAMGREADLKRRCIDDRAFATLCGSCRSILGLRHMPLAQLEREVVEWMHQKALGRGATRAVGDVIGDREGLQ